MIKEEFIQPRFVGPRFEEHTLPLSAAKDLAAYEELVLELAKHLYREKQTDRVRLPKGFASDFSLHIAKIDEGSAKPALVAMMLGSQLFASLPAELIEAKDLINAVMATEDGQAFPAKFPKDFYSYFNRIGRTLKDGEKIEWTPDLPNKTALTPANRIRLARAHRETYEAEADVVGLVEELDAKKKTGILRTLNKEAIAFVFGDPFFADLKDALGNPVVHARLKGVGVFDVNDRLGSIIEIDQLECLPHFGLVSKIDALGSLVDGWLEGNGVAPRSANLAWLTDEVAKYFPEALEYPSVVPTEDGHVVFEWIRPQARIELEVNFDAQKLELYATNLTTSQFTETSFDTSDWNTAFSKIERLLAA
jgi:hypothetical protein